MARPIDAGSGKNDQRRFSEYRTLMLKIEKQLHDTHKWTDNPTIEQVNSMYAAIANELFPGKDGGRPMSWTTFIRQKHADKKRRLEN